MSSKLAVLSVVGLSFLLGGCAARTETMGQGQQQAVWVCHGKKNPRWMKVAAPAAEGHRRHGDRISTRPREEGAPCRRGPRDDSAGSS